MTNTAESILALQDIEQDWSENHENWTGPMAQGALEFTATVNGYVFH